MVRLLLAFMLLCAIFPSFAQTPAPAGAAEPVPAGTVELVEGDVRFFDANRRMRRPKAGDRINEGESITTGADGEAHLRMEDGGYIAVRPGTRMRIVNFRAEGGAEDRSIINLLEGSFRAVTGWIAKRPRAALINTPTATIGVRGTEHEPLVIPEGSRRGEPGTYDRVHIGETEIRTKQGTVAVRPNQAGFAPVRGALRPRVLERVPDFFRPTRNEARFTGLHGRIHQQLDLRRDERRKVVEERRKGKAERPGDKGNKGAKAEDRRKDFEKKRAEKQQRTQEEKQLERRQRQDDHKRKAEERRLEHEARKGEKRDRPEKGKADERRREQEGRKAEKRERADKGKADERKAEKRSKGEK
jgi:hypothetical protein